MRSPGRATLPPILRCRTLSRWPSVATGGRPRYPGLHAHPSTRQKQKMAPDGVDRATAILRALAPDAGSYVSESNYFNRNWRAEYWGANYPRLARVKAKYDPDGLFTVHHGVGSEAWSDDGFTRRAMTG